MSSISSGTGIMSGMDIQGIVEQLMQLERRPMSLLETRVEGLTKEQTALKTLQAKLMALQISATNFNKEQIFQQKSVNSTHPDVLSATVDQFATTGSYQFQVKRLASTHHFVSRGYASLNSRIGSGTLSFEMGQGQLARPTELSFLNGQMGFRRGSIEIADRAGNSAVIDLSTALDMSEVIEQINSETAIQVTASVSGDHLILTDTSGSTASDLVVNEVNGGHAAEDLGIRGSSFGSDQLVGEDINYISTETRLSDLNDGGGVHNSGMVFVDDLVFRQAGETSALFGVDLEAKLYSVVNDPTSSNTLASLNSGAGIGTGTFKITDRNGRFVEVDMQDVYDTYGNRATLGQLTEYIQQKVDDRNDNIRAMADPATPEDELGLMDINIHFNGQDHLTFTDNSEDMEPDDAGRRSHFIIEDLDGGTAAADLGITADTVSSQIKGETIWQMDSLADVLNAVNNHWNNWDGSDRLVTMGIDPASNGITVSYHGSGTLEIDSTAAAEDLGIANSTGFTGDFTGRRIIAGLNTVMLRNLNGGQGDNRILEGGIIDLTDRSGASMTVDLTDVFTVQDVIDGINDAAQTNGVAITAAVNAAGNGITLTDNSGGTGSLIVADNTGELAQKLHLTSNDTTDSVNSGNLQLQYLSDSTLLSEMRQGQGIRRGQFKITDGTGHTFAINLAQDHIDTLGDVIQEINSASYTTANPDYDPDGPQDDTNPQRLTIHSTVQARMNDNGDGILLYSAEGDGGFTIEEDGSKTASDLRIRGTASQQGGTGNYQIDGSYEFTMNVGSDSIEDVVSRINDAEVGIRAAIINDGGNYRISFTSDVGGRAGTVYVDSGETGFQTQNLSEGSDALVLLGRQGQGGSPLLISNNTNTLDDVIKGTTLQLHATSNSTVEVAIDRDMDTIISKVESFVESYNSVMSEIAKLDSFNPETLKRGALFGDRTVDLARNSLYDILSHSFGSGSLNRLSQIGISLSQLTTQTDPDGSGEQLAVASTPKLQFDEQAFREAFLSDPTAVTELFTAAETGIGDYLDDTLEQLAGTTGESSFERRSDAMTSKREMLNERIEDLDELLALKEKRLYAEFYAMEKALASLQTQQTALSQFASMGNMNSSSGGQQ